MSRLVYFLVPLGILFSGIVVINTQRQEPLPGNVEDLKNLSNRLSVITAEPPIGLNFCGERVPMEHAGFKNRMEREIEKYMKYQAATMHTFKRMYRYQDEFLKILRRKGVPEDFFYMAVAESGLSNASSPVGAQGFWQFMKATARHYDLEVSETVDERYHPDKATVAACNYLLDAHKRFGNWTLVAAAYNMGGGRLSKSMREQNQDNYYFLKLNRETSQYVYRILGYKCIMEHPYRYGFVLNERQMFQAIPYYTVKVSEDIEDLVAFAHENGASYRELKTMNPWLISDRLDVAEGKTYTIRFSLARELNADEMLVENPAVLDSMDMRSQPEVDEDASSSLVFTEEKQTEGGE